MVGATIRAIPDCAASDAQGSEPLGFLFPSSVAFFLSAAHEDMRDAITRGVDNKWPFKLSSLGSSSSK